MAREEKVWEYAIEAGYAPLEDRCIIVKGAAGDLSEKIVRFFETWDVAVLQMCRERTHPASIRVVLGNVGTGRLARYSVCGH